MDKKQEELANELLQEQDNNPSFIRRLFFGEFSPKGVLPYPSIHMDENLISEVQTLVEKINPDEIDREQEIPKAIIDEISRLGIMGITLPKKYGGLGLSQSDYCKVTETISGRCGSTALYVNVHHSVGVKGLVLYGTEEQKKRWLPGMASGELLAAFALTEANAGSDASAVQTSAVYDAQRDGYILNGRKQWITHGAIAGILTVMARTEEGKITAFIVNPEMSGFKVLNPRLEKLGYRGTWTAIIAFEDMFVPAANILGEKGKGLKIALHVLDFGRTTFGASCTGAAKTALRLAANHAKNRQQFGHPLSDFELIKEKLARIATLTYAMEASTYLTAGLIDEGASDIMLETTLLKVFASEALWEIMYEAMQIYGGKSFFTDTPLERMLRDARLNTIGEGANEVMRIFIAAVGLRDVGLSLKKLSEVFPNPFADLKSVRAFVGNVIKRLSVPKLPVRSSYLQDEAYQLGRAVRRFGFSILRLLNYYRESIVDHQYELNRVTQATIELYTSTAVLGKLDREKDPTQIQVGKLYLHQSMKRFYQALDQLYSKGDLEVNRVSDMVIGDIL